MDDNQEMKRFADRLWDYFKPKIEELTRSNIWYFRAQVTKAAADGKITVQRPFDDEIALPYVSGMENAAVGSQVTVFVLGSSMTNAVICGDGTLHILGGGSDGDSGGGDTGGFDPVFANNSWEQIITACQSNAVPDTWAIGDNKTMTINGVGYQIDIIGKNHDAYADGSGKAPLTFQLHNIYATTYAMYDSSKNLNGWDICDMRLEHLPVVLSCMPSEIQNAIREVNKLTGVSTTTTITTTADKLFLLSEKEVLGTYGYSRDGEGDQYAYYQESSTNKQKTNITNGDYDTYWLRSPNELVNGDAAYCAINSYGNEGTRMMGYIALGIAPAFCF